MQHSIIGIAHQGEVLLLHLEGLCGGCIDIACCARHHWTYFSLNAMPPAATATVTATIQVDCFYFCLFVATELQMLWHTSLPWVDIFELFEDTWCGNQLPLPQGEFFSHIMSVSPLPKCQCCWCNNNQPEHWSSWHQWCANATASWFFTVLNQNWCF